MLERMQPDFGPVSPGTEAVVFLADPFSFLFVKHLPFSHIVYIVCEDKVGPLSNSLSLPIFFSFLYPVLQGTSSTTARLPTTARSINAGGRPVRRAASRNASVWACSRRASGWIASAGVGRSIGG